MKRSYTLFITTNKKKELRYKIAQILNTLMSTCLTSFCILICFKYNLFGHGLITDVLLILMIMSICMLLFCIIQAVFTFESWWGDV